MWIRSLSVQHWRGLESLSLSDLSPQLNVIAGPNESGKSRLAEALRFALFESSSGRAAFKRRLASWSDAGPPQVSVDFDFGGQSWTVSKTFLHNQRTRLISDREELEDEEAEARLRQLLGTQPGTAQSPAMGTQLGRWALLWIHQGESLQAPDLEGNATAQGLLQDRLASEAGVAAAGQTGQDVLRLADEERRRYYTPTGVENAAFKAQREALDVAAQARQALEAKRLALQQDADRLITLRDEAAELRERRDQALDALRRAREQAQQLEEVRQELNLLRARGENVDGQVSAATQALARIEALQEEKNTLQQHLGGLQQEVAAVEARLAAAEQERQTLAAAAAQAEADLETAQADSRRLTRGRESQRNAQRLQEQQRRLDQLRELEARQLQRQQQLAGLPAVDRDELTALQALQRDLGEARARLEGAAVRITVTAARDLRLDGEDLSAGSQRDYHITGEQQLQVEGLLALTVRPGGGELQTLEHALADQQAELRRRLQALGVDDLAAATAAFEDAETLRSELKHLTQQRDTHFAEGRSALEAEIARLQALHSSDQAGSPLPEDLDAAIAAAETALHEAEHAAIKARARRDQQGEQYQELRLQLGQLRERCQQSEQRREQVLAELSRLPGHDAAAEQQRAAEAAQREHAEALARSEARYQDMGGDRVVEAVERHDNAVASLQTRLRQAENEIIRLEAVLSRAGNDDLHEALQEAVAEESRCREALARTERHAHSARLLHEILQQEYQAEREALLEPLRRAIHGYLLELFPNVQPQLDDFQLQGLRPEGEAYTEALAELSGGTREQVSLLTRLGLAKVLAGEEGWPLLLDDALVNTDPERIEVMQRVLYRASRQHQILLFTCHGRLFDSLGADQWIDLPARRQRVG